MFAIIFHLCFCLRQMMEVVVFSYHYFTDAYMAFIEWFCLYVPSAWQHTAHRCPCGWGPELTPGIAPGTALHSHLSGLRKENRTKKRETHIKCC